MKIPKIHTKTLVKRLFILLIVLLIIFVFNKKPSYSQGIIITNPINGETFNSGENITVKVAPEGGIIFKKVLLMKEGDLAGMVDNSFPFEFYVPLPNSINQVKMYAVGTTENNEVYSTSIVLNIKKTEKLQELIISPKEINFQTISERDLWVEGVYPDGSRLDITSLDVTSYRTLSGTTDIVEISSTGTVKAKRNGKETIIVSNGEVEKSLNVIVDITNYPPELYPIGNLAVEAGKTLEVLLSATDQEGDSLWFSNMYLPYFVSILDNMNGTAILKISPTIKDVGIFSNINIDVFDKGTPSLSDGEVIVITVTPPIIKGDLDKDGDVDQADINIINSYRNKPASACPGCDLDGDGMITVNDTRKAVILCTRSRCAV